MLCGEPFVPIGGFYMGVSPLLFVHCLPSEFVCGVLEDSVPRSGSCQSGARASFARQTAFLLGKVEITVHPGMPLRRHTRVLGATVTADPLPWSPQGVDPRSPSTPRPLRAVDLWVYGLGRVS